MKQTQLQMEQLLKKIGDITFDYIEKYVDDIVTVSDYELMAAFLVLVEKHKIVAENSGILAVAGLKKIKCYREKDNFNNKWW